MPQLWQGLSAKVVGHFLLEPKMQNPKCMHGKFIFWLIYLCVCVCVCACVCVRARMHRYLTSMN